MTTYSTLRATGYSGPPPNAALFATKPVTINPLITNTIMALPPVVDVALAGDQKEAIKGGASPLGTLGGVLGNIFNE